MIKLKPLTHVDFFAGCGGVGLGFKNAGFDTVAAFDFDKYAVQSYQANVHECVKQRDISKQAAEEIPESDVWTFGFPCQDLSIAGKQAGLFEGKRSGLFFEIMRLLDETPEECKPKIIMAENVKGLKPYLQTLKEEYAKVGYIMYVKLFNSKYWNVPQSRERYFVVGVRKDLDKGFYRFPKEQTDFIPKLSSVLESNVPEKYYLSDDKAQSIFSNKEVAATKEQSEPKIEKLGNVNPSGRGMNGDVFYAEGLAPTLTTNKGEGIKIMFKEPSINVVGRLDIRVQKDQQARVYAPEGISPTLTAVTGGHHHIKIFDPNVFRVRKLTPREYARLQGFPDSFKFIVSDSQLYKQFGNAVTVNVAEAIANSIKEHLI